MRLLITGGAGFIGSNLVRLALKEGHEVINFDKLTYATNPLSLKELNNVGGYVFVRGDITDKAHVSETMMKYRPDALVNLAAETHVDRSIESPECFIHTNVVGTYCLLETFREYRGTLNKKSRDCLRFLHVSTDEVYGSLGDEGVFREDTPYAPSSPYSASKAAADHLVFAYHKTYDLPTMITNCSNNYGPYQFPEKLIPLMIESALALKPLPVYGDGRNVRDWLYVEDHCRALLKVLESGKPGERYNIGGGCEKKNLEVVHTICDTLDRLHPARTCATFRALVTFVSDRPGHDRRYAVDAGKIKDTLGWCPLETFERAIDKTVRWYLSNREWVSGILSNTYKLERLGMPS